jgi:glucokinase
MVLDRNETEPCGCGKLGCAEQYCSATGVVRMAKRYMATDDRPSMLRGREITCKEIFDAAAAGDAVAAAALETVYARMAEFCANLANAFDPAVIVLGGGVSKAGDVLLKGIRPYFDKFVFHANRDVEFTLAVLGNDAGAYGAFKLILDAVG